MPYILIRKDFLHRYDPRTSRIVETFRSDADEASAALDAVQQITGLTEHTDEQIATTLQTLKLELQECCGEDHGPCQDCVRDMMDNRPEEEGDERRDWERMMRDDADTSNDLYGGAR